MAYAEAEEDQTLPCDDKLAFDGPKQAQAAATVALHQHGTVLRVIGASIAGYGT